MHVDVPTMGGEVPKPIECGVGLESTVIIREGDEGFGVEADAKVFGKCPGEPGVQPHALALERYLDIRTAAANLDRAHQERARVVDAIVIPLHETNTERNGVESPGVFQILGVLHQSHSRFVSGSSRHIITDQVAQQCGRTGQKPGETAGVAPADVDAVLRAV